jgi:hypothetical protein
MVEPREHLAAARCVKGAAEDAVLDMVEAVVLAYVRDFEPDAVAGDVVDDEGEKLLPAHTLFGSKESVLKILPMPATDPLGGPTVHDVNNSN